MNHIASHCRWPLMFCLTALWINSAVAQPLAIEEVDEAEEVSMQTLAVVASTNYDKQVGDINFLGALGGMPEAGMMIEGGINFFTQGKGVAAIDRTKPWGVIVLTDGAQFIPIGCLPVAKPDDLLAVAAMFQAQTTDHENGVRELSLPNEQSIFIKSEGGWTFIGQSAESLTHLPADPLGTLNEIVTGYNFAATIIVKNVPEMYRQFIVMAMQSGMQQGMQPLPGESDEEFDERREMTEAQMQQVVQSIEEIELLTFGWSVDAGQQRSYIDFVYQFTADGRLAEQLAALKEPSTNFAGFYQPNAVGTMTIAQEADLQQIDAEWLETQQAQGRSTLVVWRQQAKKQLVDELGISDEAAVAAVEAAIDEMFDAAVATMESGKTDAGASLDVHPDALTLVAGGFLLETGKVESALRRLATVVDDLPHVAAIEMNTDNHAGVAFHRITINVPDNAPEAQDVLGEQVDVAVGIGPQAVYVALGQNHMAAVKQAIDASLAEPNKRVPMFELAISLGPIMELVATQVEDETQRGVAESIAAMLRDEAQGRDHVRMVGQVIPAGLRYRLEVEEGVLRAIGTAAAAAAQQQRAAMMQQ